MKAIQIGRFGGPDVLELVEIDTPAPGPGQVLVRTQAIGVNFADTLMREDRYAITPPLPSVLGSEVGGVVEQLGEGVTGIATGARVLAPMFAAGQMFGGYADYVVIDAGWVVPVPDAISFETAVTLTVQGLSALHLVRQARPEGKTVLVNAAAGGVGSILIQLARHAGAKKIIAAASTKAKRDFCLSLGADVAVDYTSDVWLDDLRAETGGAGPDIIYELAGGKITRDSLAVLAPLGQIVIYGALNIQDFALGVPELLALIFKNQSLTGFAVAPLLTPANIGEGLGELFDQVVLGVLKVEIGGVFALDQAAQAHTALQSRGTIGKIILKP